MLGKDTYIASIICKDKDNIAAGIKFILDGLTKSKILKGDSWKYIGTITHKFEVAGKPCVVVTLSC